ncbi:MAG: hypothetical protein ACM335_11455 [Deltaproteobacteria bacterium]
MERKPELPVEVETVLRRYLQIQAEEQKLKEEKTVLREKIGQHMADLRMKYWYPKIDGQAVKVRYNETTTIEYNEAILHDRLGDRYLAILAPDVRKIRASLDKLESLFTPVLSRIGSPSPEKIRLAIENGTVSKESFAGAFKKTVKRFVAVGKVWNGGASDNSEDNNAHQTTISLS